ncbi:hypothetical protein BC829DRAFT_404393 [Chytridium lagenaria]|nr:hypothetical protein BC829DRAFT_404393 [Chytridium lagenaria]
MGGPGYYTTSPSTVPGGYSMVASAGPPWGMGQPAPYGLHPYHAVQQGGGQYNQMQSSSQS